MSTPCPHGKRLNEDAYYLEDLGCFDCVQTLRGRRWIPMHGYHALPLAEPQARSRRPPDRDADEPWPTGPRAERGSALRLRCDWLGSTRHVLRIGHPA